MLWAGLECSACAESARAGRHVAIYWDGSIRLEVGVELYGPFAEEGEVVHSATPAGPVAWTTHFGPYSAWALRTMQFASGVEPTIANLLRPLAKRMEYESIANPNRYLLPADLLTPARCGRVQTMSAFGGTADIG